MEGSAKKVNINYKYFLEYIKNQRNYKDIKVLDYGCGKGEILQLLLDNGIDAYGVDIYHQGPSDEVLNSDLYKRGKIKIIKINEKLPFDDKSFDLIISNQVFEHVSDMKFVFDELERILRDDGKMYHHFPSKEVWREGHIGIPFSHWFKKNSTLRYCYVFLLRALGFGYNKKNKTIKKWVEHSLDYIDNYCYYRSEDELEKIMFNYEIKHREIDYIKFRANNNILKSIVDMKIFFNIYQNIFKKLAFMSIELKNKK